VRTEPNRQRERALLHVGVDRTTLETDALDYLRETKEPFAIILASPMALRGVGSRRNMIDATGDSCITPCICGTRLKTSLTTLSTFVGHIHLTVVETIG
jgi:hypothetical protein